MRNAFLVAVILLILVALPGVVAFTTDVLGYGADINTWAEAKFGVSHRLALGVPAALVMFCIPLLIILLYFLRLKRKPLSIASTYLWKKSTEDLHVNRLMQWLRRNVLLLLQLLAILLMLYAVLGPRTLGALSAGKPYILLLDNSCSMNATDVADGFAVRLDWAKAEALKAIDSANEGDPGLLIVFNSTAEIRQSYTFNKEELRTAVNAVRPTQHLTRLDEALALAASRANPAKSTENAAMAPANPEPGKQRTYFSPEGVLSDIYLFSDGRFPAVPDFALQNLNIVFPKLPIEKPLPPGTSDNVGIIGLEAQRDADRPGRVYVTVLVLNDRPTATDISVSLNLSTGDGQLLKAYTSGPQSIPGKPAELPAEEPKKAEARPINVLRVPFTVTEVTANTDLKLDAKIEHAGDALGADDTASLVFGVARKARVSVVTPGNKWQRNYFDLPSTKGIADFTYLAPSDMTDAALYLGPVRDGLFDVVVFDRCGPATDDAMPQANTLFIGHVPPPYTMTAGTPNSVTPLKMPIVRAPDARHPLMKDIRSLDDLKLDEAFKLPSLPPRTPRLIEADNDTALLVALERQAFTDAVLCFPLAVANVDGPDRLLNSTWPLQPSFVVFLRNLLYRLGDVRDTGAEDGLKPGDVLRLRPGSATEAIVRPPGSAAPVVLTRGKRPEVLFNATDDLGVYTADWGSGATKETRRFAVNLLDSDESSLAPATNLKIGAVTVASGENRRVPVELWKFAVVLALAVAFVEWWIYNRRVQI